LLTIGNRHPKAHLREPAALRKIAASHSVNHVAHHLLLRRHHHKTVAHWRWRYLTEGIARLFINAGGGHQVAFQPQFATPIAAQEALLHTVNRAPEALGQAATRQTTSKEMALAESFIFFH
jgi:hypothetical protein